MFKKVLKILIFIQTILFTFMVFDVKVLASNNIGVWNVTSPLTHAIASHTSFISSGKINIIAGATSVARQWVSFSEINPNGSLGTWQFSSLNYPGSIYYHSTVYSNNFVYGLGGNTYPPFTSLNSVYLGIVEEGIVTSWTPVTPLPNQLSLGNAVAVGNRIYYAGGFRQIPLQPVTYSDKVYVAEINIDGTISGWSTTTDLPAALSGFGMIETGNKIIIIGGYNHDAFDYTDKVYESVVNPDGNLGTWEEKDPLPKPIYRSGVTKIENLAISVGGVSTSNQYTSDVFYSEIQGNGSLGHWQTSTNSFPHAWCCGSLTATNTHLYYTGGHDGGSYFNNVYYASLGEVTEGLNVPDIKQYSPPWGPHKYDNSTSTPNTITRWGCALTSAVMTLRYYNHDVDPDSLNSWLINHNGYNRESGINWGAVATFSKQSPQKINLNLPLKHIEWKRYSEHNDSILDNQLNVQQPVILNVPGHFVVAKGKLDGDYLINDPASDTFNLLSQTENYHGGSYWKIETYTPSNSDFSYIYLLVDENFQIEVFDPEGNKVVEGYSIEEPIMSDDGLNQSEGNPLNSFALPKPENGFYKILLTGSGNYQLDSYIYDVNGNVNFSESLGTLQEGETDTYLINLDKINSEESSFSEVSFESLLTDLDEAYAEGKFTRRGVYKSLRSLVYLAKRYNGRDRSHIAKLLLKVARKQITKFSPQFIEQNTADFLIIKINLLINSL